MRSLALCLLLGLTAASSLFALDTAPGVTFYVSPSGSDANPGTKDRPFATVGRAQRAVRPRLAASGADITVLLRGGRYELSEPLVFGARDGGTETRSVTYAAYPGEAPVISGGRRVASWKRGTGSLWTAEIPQVKAGEWYFRQLFVGGPRATRARTPNADGKPAFLRLAGVDINLDKQTETFKLPEGAVKDWHNVGDVEIVCFGQWEIVRKRLLSADPAANAITLQPPHVKAHDANRPYANNACYLEDALEMLDSPGEWYLDRATGVLSYWPLPGQDMTRAEVIAPVLTRLVDVRGTSQQPVQNLHFRGLRFAHTDGRLPAQGHEGLQAGFFVGGKDWGETDKWDRMDEAVRLEYARSCSVTDGVLNHLGGVGLSLRRGCMACRVEGNEVTDIAANGLMCGENWGSLFYDNSAPPPADIPVGNRLANNHIHACGKDFYGSVGVWTAFTDGTVVAHNLIHDLPYTGISVGFVWDSRPTSCKNNVIEYNHIYDVMQRLADGGGIYTLGFQPGAVLRGNFIHDVRYSETALQSRFSNNGIFFDNGSKGNTVEDNVIYATAGPPIRHNDNAVAGHTWTNNTFGVSVSAPGKFGRALACDGSSSFVEVPHSAALEPQQMTIEAWVKLDAFPAIGGAPPGDPRRWIVNKNKNEWQDGHYALMIEGAKVGAYLNIGGGQANAHFPLSEKDVLTLSTWQHLAMTYDGTDLVAYCDGKPVATEKIGKPRTPGNLPLSIGRRQDAYNYFAGSIDEVRIYNRPLSTTELKAHASAKLAPPVEEPGLIARWGFDELTAAAAVVEAAAAKAGPEPPYRDRFKP